MFFIYRPQNNEFFDPFRQRIVWNIRHPDQMNWEAELTLVQQIQASLTPEQERIAQYWGTGEATEKMTRLIFHLADKYRIGSPMTARILAFFHAAINDAFVMSWYFKYLWDVARPNQYNQDLSTVVFTPRFPSYPSAHATVAGCAEVIMSYFFPREAAIIKRMVEECALSRLYAGVHFKIDNDEGLRLGRQIGGIVVQLMRAQNR
ncbi:vanadium-dependent haloperoxidase [Niallia endozanthoxylica]|uniref:Vanadium-dependent haloperoxidase n=2 Tax=Niallia endozanthoxylica TaxID=2036016 RepID=A0A5J5HZT8_9BACI|nr:vanadium-dependent haloperoxidase [Niallia endozanthoxylica]